MRDIDDAHDAEHQRQAKRRQRQHGGGDGAFENGEEKMGEEGQGRADSVLIPLPHGERERSMRSEGVRAAVAAITPIPSSLNHRPRGLDPSSALHGRGNRRYSAILV